VVTLSTNKRRTLCACGGPGAADNKNFAGSSFAYGPVHPIILLDLTFSLFVLFTAASAAEHLPRALSVRGAF